MIFLKNYYLSILAGLLLGLSLLDHMEFLVLIGLIPLYLSWIKPGLNLKYYFTCGFIAEFIFMGFAFYWIQNAGKTYFLLNSFSSFLFFILFISLFSLHWGLIGLLFGWFQRQNFKFLIFTLPFFMILADDLVFKFFPFHFGFHWFAAQLPGLTWSSIIGLSGLGFVVLVINLFLTLLIRRQHLKISFIGLVFIILILFFAPQIEPSNAFIQTLGVQGNISNEIKRTDLQVMANKMISVDRYYSLTRKGIKENSQTDFDLIIWPETTLPFVWKTDAKNKNLDLLQIDALSFSQRLNKSILSGSYFEEVGTYNSVILMTPDLNFTHSEKKYLFPIGEIIPFNDFGGITKSMFPEVPRFKAEKEPAVLRIKNYNVVVPICYESLFSEYFDSFNEPIEWIISLSNDAWFESNLQKKWHGLMALSRSIEYQVPVLRVTNNGNSGTASSTGEYSLITSLHEQTFSSKIYIAKKVEKSWMQKSGKIVNRLPRFISYFFILLLIGLGLKRRLH